MNTNSKVFRDQVRSYILDNIENQKISDIVDQFKNEVGSANNIRLNGSVQNAFIYWLQGLPTNISFDFSNYEIEKVLKQWFENADLEYKEKADFTDRYYYLLWKECNYLFEKETGESIAIFIMK